MAYSSPASTHNPTTGQVIPETWGDAVNAAADYLATNKPNCRAWRNAALNIAAASAVTLIAMDTESWDVGGNFSTGTGRFTAPDAGKYLVTGQCSVNVINNPDEFEIGIYVNATLVSAGERVVDRSATGGDDLALTVSDIVNVAASDVIDLRVNHPVGTLAASVNVGSSVRNYISIMWVAT